MTLARTTLIEIATAGKTIFGRPRIAPKTPLVLAALRALTAAWKGHADVEPIFKSARRSKDPAVRAAAGGGRPGMSVPTEFLTAVAQALSTMSLYVDGHPARERAVDRAYRYLVDLQDEDVHGVFTFLGGEIVFGRRPLRGLKHWDWGTRLSEAGLQRLEFIGPVTRDGSTSGPCVSSAILNPRP